MMKQEFEKRIGLVISSEEYCEIEAAYMGLPESVDKDKFCRMWLKEGGIQDLFDKRMVKIHNLKNEISRLNLENQDYLDGVNKNEKLAIELWLKVKELEEKLSAINAMSAA